MNEPSQPAAPSSPPSPPSRLRRVVRFAARLLVRFVVFVVLLAFFLLPVLTEEIGGVWAWLRSVIDENGGDARLPGGAAGLVAIALLLFVNAMVLLGALIKLVLGSLAAFVLALVQTTLLFFLGGPLVDIVRLWGRIERDDPRYGRKCRARGALVALVLTALFVATIALCTRPRYVPSPSEALAFFELAGVVTVTIGALVGALRKKRPPSP